MKYFKNTLKFNIEHPTVITIGKFDGLHRGHELLLEEVFKQKETHGYQTVVFTFDMPPKARVENSTPCVLTSNEEKELIFSQTGLDYLIECPFTDEIMHMEPENFIAWLVDKMQVKCFVVGEDFHFGHKRAGDYKLLQQFEKKYGYETVVFPKMQEDGRDISSTYVREEIAKGNISKANQLLGYPYFIKSTVVHGRKLGRTIGIPTINMVVPEDKILPPNGVYATSVTIDGKTYLGVTNVGKKPTVGKDNPMGIETHIISFEQDLYGEMIQVDFLEFLRFEQKFDSIEALQHQMNCDIEKTKQYFAIRENENGFIY